MSVLNKGSFESSDRRKFLKVLASGTALALTGTAGVAHGSPETVSSGHGEEEIYDALCAWCCLDVARSES